MSPDLCSTTLFPATGTDRTRRRERCSWKLRQGSCFSGCWRYVHVEGEGLGVGVVVAGVAFQGERDGGHAVALGVPAGQGAATVDVQGRNAVMPVAGFRVEEQLDPQRAHHLIVL